MVNSIFNNTKIRIPEGKLNLIVNLLKERRLSRHYKVDTLSEKWDRFVFITNNQYHFLYTESVYKDLKMVEITMDDLLANKIVERKHPGLDAIQKSIVNPVKAKRKYTKKPKEEAPLERGDLVQITKTEEVGILTYVGNVDNVISRVFVLILGGNNHSQVHTGVLKEITRFKGKITLKG